MKSKFTFCSIHLFATVFSSLAFVVVCIWFLFLFGRMCVAKWLLNVENNSERTLTQAQFKSSTRKFGANEQRKNVAKGKKIKHRKQFNTMNLWSVRFLYKGKWTFSFPIWLGPHVFSVSFSAVYAVMRLVRRLFLKTPNLFTFSSSIVWMAACSWPVLDDKIIETFLCIKLAITTQSGRLSPFNNRKRNARTVPLFGLPKKVGRLVEY